MCFMHDRRNFYLAAFVSLLWFTASGLAAPPAPEERAACETSDLQARLTACPKLLKRDLEPADRIMTLGNLAIAQRSAGKYKNALANFDKALGIYTKAGIDDPALKQVIVKEKGRTYTVQGKFAEAIPILKQALAINRENADVVALLAWAQLDLGDDDGAQATLDAATVVRGDAKWLPWLRGRLLYRKGDYAAARKQFERSLFGNEAFPDAWHYLAVVSLAEKNYDAAVKEATRAIEYDQGFDSPLIVRGRARAYLKDAGAAIDDFNRALALRPGNPDAYHGQGLAYLQIGDWPKAEIMFRRALELAANHFASWKGIGDVDVARGSPDSAREAYKKAASFKPKTQEDRDLQAEIAAAAERLN
ncbi:MAG: tetratricopeptide repeat protein [Aestuariivirga sp.]